MKIGDTYDVTLGGVKVTEARVTYMEDGIAELIFEGQRVKMTYVTQLAPELTEPVDQPKMEPSKQVIIDGVDRPSDSAPVGGTAEDVPVNIAQEAATVVPVVESGPATLATPPEVVQEAATVPVEAAEKPAAAEAS